MGRVEEFLVSSTTWSEARSSAKRVDPADVAEAAKKAGATVSLGYFVGTAQHEANFAVNERDTEESGYMSYGIYQLGLHEARSVRMPSANLLDLDQATRVMVTITESRRQFLRQILNLHGNVPDPHDMCAYLAICHNAGENDGSIKNLPRYGMVWDGPKGWKTRNADEAKKWVATATDLLNQYNKAGSPEQVRLGAKDLEKAKSFALWVPKMSAYGDDCLRPWP